MSRSFETCEACGAVYHETERHDCQKRRAWLRDQRRGLPVVEMFPDPAPGAAAQGSLFTGQEGRKP